MPGTNCQIQTAYNASIGLQTEDSCDQNGNLSGDSWLGNVGTYGWDTENVRHEVAWGIITRDRPDVTGCPITRTLRGSAARQRAV